MKQKIAASAIAGIKDFAAVAASHAVEMKAWRQHMARVKQDEKNDVPIERRHVAYPRPRAHPMGSGQSMRTTRSTSKSWTMDRRPPSCLRRARLH
jgi:hypothetical protein